MTGVVHRQRTGRPSATTARPTRLDMTRENTSHRTRSRLSVLPVVLALSLAFLLPACNTATGNAGPKGQTGSTTTATAVPTTTTPPMTATTVPITPTSVPPPTTTLPGSLYGRVWSHIPTTEHVVALTFDGGANADGLPSILRVLRTSGVPASFFLTGAFARDFPTLARDVATGGFRIGNHSVDHPYFTRLSDSQIRSEVMDAAGIIKTITGTEPSPFFRFPYGDRDARTLSVVNGLGYVAIGWTVDTLGWEGTSGGITVQKVITRVMDSLTPGEIVLMHVGSNPSDRTTLDADALPAIIQSLRSAGYSFVTLGDFIGSR
jgi:peptidoglycan/xylan/chitin deacetylase (PgdA/CDA1 family)